MRDYKLRWLEEAAKWPGHKATLDSVKRVVRQTSRPPKQREVCAVCG